MRYRYRFVGASGQLKDLGFDDAIGIVLNAVLAEGEVIQHGFEQSIAGFNQMQIGDPFFHFRRFGRLRQLLHQGQFVGLIAPRRRLVGVFLPQQGIEQRPGVRRQQLLDRAGQTAVMLIDGGQDECGQGEIPGDLDLLSDQHLEGAGENQLWFQVRLDQAGDFSRGAPPRGRAA